MKPAEDASDVKKLRAYAGVDFGPPGSGSRSLQEIILFGGWGGTPQPPKRQG